MDEGRSQQQLHPRAMSKEMEQESEGEEEEEMRLFRLRVECRMIEVKNMIKQRYRRLKEMLETPTSAYDRYKGVGQALKMSDCPYGKAGSNCSGIIGEEPGEDLRTLVVEKTTRGSSFERVIGLDEYWHLKAQHYETTESHEDIKALDFLSKYREIQEPVLRSSLTFPCAASSIHTETISPSKNEGRTIISTEEAERKNLLDKENVEHVEAYISAVPTEAVFNVGYDLVNWLKLGCQRLFIAAVEYFGPGNKFEALKELEIPYKRTKMDNSLIVYIIRMYIYLKKSPEITKALLVIEQTICPEATTIDYGVFRIPFYLGYLSQRMKYDAEKTPFQNASIPNAPRGDANNVKPTLPETVSLDGHAATICSFHVKKPGFYRLVISESDEAGERIARTITIGDENSKKRNRDEDPIRPILESECVPAFKLSRRFSAG